MLFQVQGLQAAWTIRLRPPVESSFILVTCDVACVTKELTFDPSLDSALLLLLLAVLAMLSSLPDSLLLTVTLLCRLYDQPWHTFDLFERLHPNLARSRGGRVDEVCLALLGRASRHRESVSVGILEGINFRGNNVHFTPQGTHLVCRQRAIVLQTGKRELARFGPLPRSRRNHTT